MITSMDRPKIEADLRRHIILDRDFPAQRSETAKSVDLEDARVVTTEEVLSEFLTGVAGFGERTGWPAN